MKKLYLKELKKFLNSLKAKLKMYSKIYKVFIRILNGIKLYYNKWIKKDLT